MEMREPKIRDPFSFSLLDFINGAPSHTNSSLVECDPLPSPTVSSFWNSATMVAALEKPRKPLTAVTEQALAEDYCLICCVDMKLD